MGGTTPTSGGMAASEALGVSPALDLHAWVRRLDLDLWFCPMTNLDPRHLPIPTVVTIADIQQEYYPEFFTREELQARALMYGPSCQEATAAIAISDFSKQCVIEKYGLVPEKVHRTYVAGVAQVDESGRLANGGGGPTQVSSARKLCLLSCEHVAA